MQEKKELPPTRRPSLPEAKIPSASIREAAAIFDTGVRKHPDRPMTWKVAFVPPACFRTFDFNKEPDVVMASVVGKSFQAPVLLIKSKNPATGKYDGIVTMANLCLTSTNSVELAVKVLKYALDDHLGSGGKLEPNTSLQLLARCKIMDAGDIMTEAIRLYSIDYPGDFTFKQQDKRKFKEHQPSTCKVNEGAIVFVSQGGTQIIKFEKNKIQDAVLAAPEDPLLPLAFLRGIHEKVPQACRDVLERQVEWVDKNNPSGFLRPALRTFVADPNVRMERLREL